MALAAISTCGASSGPPSSKLSHRSLRPCGLWRPDLSAYHPQKYESLEGYATEVIELCRALDIIHGVFVGHSVSAMIGAIVSLKAPDIFDDPVMIGPSPRYIDDPDYTGGFSEAQIHELLDFLAANHMGWSQCGLAPNLDHSDAKYIKVLWCRSAPGPTPIYEDAIVVVVPHVTAHDGDFLRLDTHLADGEICSFVARSGHALFDTVTTMSLGETFLNPNARSGAMPVT